MMLFGGNLALDSCCLMIRKLNLVLDRLLYHFHSVSILETAVEADLPMSIGLLQEQSVNSVLTIAWVMVIGL